jgi:hypothetical protein
MPAAIRSSQSSSGRPASAGMFGVSELYIDAYPEGTYPKVTDGHRRECSCKSSRERVETRTYGVWWGPISAASKGAPVSPRASRDFSGHQRNFRCRRLPTDFLLRTCNSTRRSQDRRHPASHDPLRAVTNGSFEAVYSSTNR